MRIKGMILIMVCALVVLPHVTFCFPGVSEAQTSAMRVPVGAQAPDFTLKSIEGKEVTLSSYFGKKVVMLEFWATWCGICKEEIPTLVKDYNAFRDKGVEFLAITLQPEIDEEMKDLVQKHKITYPILMDERLNVATKVYGLAGPIPLKVIIGADGKVKYTHVGDYPDGEDEVPFVLEDLIKDIPKDAGGDAPKEATKEPTKEGPKEGI